MKKNDTYTFITKEDGRKVMIVRTKNNYEVWLEGVFTGYTFRSLAKATEYANYGI